MSKTNIPVLTADTLKVIGETMKSLTVDEQIDYLCGVLGELDILYDKLWDKSIEESDDE